MDPVKKALEYFFIVHDVKDISAQDFVEQAATLDERMHAIDFKGHMKISSLTEETQHTKVLLEKKLEILKADSASNGPEIQKLESAYQRVIAIEKWTKLKAEEAQINESITLSVRENTRTDAAIKQLNENIQKVKTSSGTPEEKKAQIEALNEEVGQYRSVESFNRRELHKDTQKLKAIQAEIAKLEKEMKKHQA